MSTTTTSSRTSYIQWLIESRPSGLQRLVAREDGFLQLCSIFPFLLRRQRATRDNTGAAVNDKAQSRILRPGQLLDLCRRRFLRDCGGRQKYTTN